MKFPGVRLYQGVRNRTIPNYAMMLPETLKIEMEAVKGSLLLVTLTVSMMVCGVRVPWMSVTLAAGSYLMGMPSLMISMLHQFTWQTDLVKWDYFVQQE